MANIAELDGSTYSRARLSVGSQRETFFKWYSICSLGGSVADPVTRAQERRGDHQGDLELPPDSRGQGSTVRREPDRRTNG